MHSLLFTDEGLLILVLLYRTPMSGEVLGIFLPKIPLKLS